MMTRRPVVVGDVVRDEVGRQGVGPVGDVLRLCRLMSVLTRGLIRAHAQMCRNGLIRSGSDSCVSQNRSRKALGGGTALVRHAS